MTRSVELATILLTDLCGSTSLAARVGPARADQLRDEYFALLRSAFQVTGGREFKNSGDGLWAAFTSASAAVGCAVRIQQEIEQRHRGSDERPHVRVGLSAGESTVDDGDYFGMPSIEAARLCDRAEPDGILVSPAVRLLAGRCEGVELRSVGDLELKGIPDPMEAFAVDWTPLAEAWAPPMPDDVVVPLPGRLTTPYAVDFVGRERENAVVLVDALTAAGTGERRVVLVSGEAGMGKTRLVSDVAARAYAGGATVLYGRCEEGLAIPYQPWAEVLGHLVEHVGLDVVTGGDAVAGAHLTRLLPGLTADRLVGGGPSPVGDQYVLYGAVTAVLRHLTEDRTVVLVLDDLHWADEGTLLLLGHLASALADASLLVIGTYRDTDLGADHPLLDVVTQLHRGSGVDRIALAGLSDDEVTSLLEVVAGHSMDDGGTSLARSLRSETSGSPFFLVEMVRHLAETGMLVRRDDGQWVPTVPLSEIELPQGVRAVVGQRVRRLGAEARKALAVASVIGREFEGSLLAAILELTEDTVLDLLERAMRARLIAETDRVDRFTFTHALVQHSLYHELSMTRRARLHLVVAREIERAAGDRAADRAGELAHHLFAATRPADLDRAISYSLQAGDRALRAAAPVEAMRWFTRALEAHEGTERERAAIVVRLGEAERRAGRAGYRERLLHGAELADRAGADDVLVTAAIANYRGWHSSSGEVDHERVAVLRKALDRVGDGDSADRALLLGTLAGEFTYGDESRFDLAREAAAVARRLADPTVLVDAILRAGSAMNVPELIAERRSRSEEALAISETQDDPVRRFFALEVHGDVSLASADMETARRCDAERHAIAERLRQPTLVWQAIHGSSVLDLVEGDTAAAERGAARARDIGVETGQPDAMMYYGSVLMATRLHQGRGAELVPMIRGQLEATPGLPVFRAVLATCLTLAGERDEARGILDEMAREGYDFPHDVAWLTANVMAAEAAGLLSHRPAAEALYDRLAPHSQQVACTRTNCQGPVSYYAGVLARVLGRDDPARSHLEDALVSSGTLRSPYNRARAMVALAPLLRDSDPDRSRHLLGEAGDLAERFGMAVVGRDAAGRF